MKNLKELNKELKENLKNELLKAKLYNKVVKKTKIDNLIIYSDNSISFFWNGQKATKENVITILKAYQISKDEQYNKKVTFSSSEKNFVTDSNLFLTWCNYDKLGAKDLKINYTSKCGLKISINIPFDFYPSNYTFWKVKQGGHLGFGRYEQTNQFYIDTPFNLQRYSGGHCLYYFLEGAETLKEYINFIFSGDFLYENEIKNNLFK